MFIMSCCKIHLDGNSQIVSSQIVHSTLGNSMSIHVVSTVCTRMGYFLLNKLGMSISDQPNAGVHRNQSAVARARGRPPRRHRSGRPGRHSRYVFKVWIYQGINCSSNVESCVTISWMILADSRCAIKLLNNSLAKPCWCGIVVVLFSFCIGFVRNC